MSLTSKILPLFFTATLACAHSGDYDGTFTIDTEYVAGLGDLDECGGRFGVIPGFA